MMLELTPAQRHLVDALYRRIDHEPQVLLEHDGSAPRSNYDVVIARLIGRDDELVDEMRLHEPLDQIRMAYPVPMHELMALDDPVDFSKPAHYEAVWNVQSVYARAVLSAEEAGDWPWDPATFRCRVLGLRYRLPPLV